MKNETLRGSTARAGIWAPAIALAVAAGGAGLYFHAPASEPSRPPKSKVAPRPAETAPTPATLELVRSVGSHVSSELDGLRARLDRLEADAAESTASAAPPPEHDPEAERAREEEESARLHAELQALLETHESAPRDVSWARETGEVLRASLTKVADALSGQAQVGDVDCRQDSCVAKLTFTSRDAAAAEHARYVTAYHGLPCAATVLLPEADVKGAVEVPFVFTECNP